MELPDPYASAERSRRARERSDAAAARLAHAEERLEKAQEELAAATNARERAAHRREIVTHERAIEFHRQAVQDQAEAAALLARHEQVDVAANEAGSMLAVTAETSALLEEGAAHHERMMRHADRERDLIADAAMTNRREREETLSRSQQDG